MYAVTDTGISVVRSNGYLGFQWYAVIVLRHKCITPAGVFLLRFCSGFPRTGQLYATNFIRISVFGWMLVGLSQRVERPPRARAEAPSGGFARGVSPSLTTSQRVPSVDFEKRDI